MLYQDEPQVAGALNHRKVDEKQYSTQKKFLQGMEIYSEKYGLCRKIDLYDAKSRSLIERKSRIKTIYDGYKYQVYAQYFCLTKMGFAVEHLYLHSLEDNKRYELDLPSVNEINRFEQLLRDITGFDILKQGFMQNPEKCKRCIYSCLCDFSNP